MNSILWLFTSGFALTSLVLWRRLALCKKKSPRGEAAELSSGRGNLEKTQAEVARLAKTLEKVSAERARAYSRLEDYNKRDQLTSAWNRQHLMRVLAELRGNPEMTDKVVTVLHVDLNNFKGIYEQHYQEIGDEVLKRSASMLSVLAPHSEVIARVGEDEFVIASLAEKSDRGALMLANLIVHEFAKPMFLSKGSLCVGASVGVARHRVGDMVPDDLLAQSALALDRAQRNREQGYAIFDNDMAYVERERRDLETQILNGLRTGAFVPYYQPQFDANTLDCVGVEALVRWNHPERGVLGPGAFLDVVEKMDKISELDATVLAQAELDYLAWQAKGLDMPKVSINTSLDRLRQLGRPGSLNGLAFKPGVLTFEMLEAIFFDREDERVSWAVDSLRDRGFNIELDDFGSGHASILALVMLSPTRLKIDRQLVMPIETSESHVQLVRAVVEIGRALNMGVVAEGVETCAQVDILRELGCDTLQGFGLARPMPGQAIPDFVSMRSWDGGNSTTGT